MKLLFYCTKNKWRLFFDKVKQIFSLGKIKSNNDLNGKIVAECDFEVEEIELPNTYSDFSYILSMQSEIESICCNSCLSKEELYNYLNNKSGKAIHIKNLHIFDEPKELSDYKYLRKTFFGPLGNAPQNMMYAYELNEYELIKKVLISIQPQWLCKILNGEKTIEVRKKVLKEMIK